MKKDLSGVISALPYRGFFFSCLGVNLVIAFLIIALQNLLPPVVPLLYQLPLGEEQLVPKIFLTVPSFVAIIVVIINMFLLRVSKDSFTPKVLVGLSIAATLLASITSIKIFLLVASF